MNHDDDCERLHAYVDDELDDVARDAFEAHLASCEACAVEMPRLLALLSSLDQIAPRPARLVVLPGGRSTEPAPHAAPLATPRRRPTWLIAGVAGTLAALAATWLLVLRPSPAPALATLDGLRATRGIEPRLTARGADRYRLFSVARGDQTVESIALDRMAALERTGQWHALADAWLLVGDRDRAAQAFARAPETPAIEIDRAALAIVEGDPASLERAIEHAEHALAADPDDPAARWNHGLALAGLGLTLAAARDFDAVAARDEPGWREEARQRADALRADATRHRTRWQRAQLAGAKAIDDGTPVPDELLEVTGFMTLMFYDAVRSAPSRARVEALLPMATSLDRIYRSDHLTTYAKRIAASDFAARKPLADAYRALVQRTSTLEPAALLERLGRADVAGDLWMGAVIRTGQVARHLDRYRALAAASGDPWFQVIAAHESARAELARGEPANAENHLREALDTARRQRLDYRALQLETELAALHRKQRNLGAAHDAASAAFRDATASGDALMAMNALGDLAAINQDRYAHGLARAYLDELLARSQPGDAVGPSPFDAAHDCATRRYVHGSLADMRIFQQRFAQARAEADQIERCPVDATTERALTLRTALIRTDLYRAEHRPDDLERARAAVSELRSDASGGAAQQAMATYIQGALELADDRAAGQRLLRAAIEQAERADDNLDLRVKARAYSYSLLAIDAGRVGAYADVVRVLGETLGVRPPDRCVVAIAVQGATSTVALADAAGAVTGTYVAHRRGQVDGRGARAAGGAAEWQRGVVDIPALVPPAFVERLRACTRVAVLARAPVLGAGRLLPPELAWSYVVAPAAAARPDAPAKRVVITNPTPPRELALPPLAPYDAGDAATVLSGADATPSRVLLAMRDATELELHTHGFIANDVSESSYLVLSPEIDHTYKLTANDVAGATLEAAPLVILGACHAATSSRALEGGTGLAEAFLRAGARAVIASPEAVQDLGAAAFFSAVRARIQRGVDPAIAVRDERMQHRASSRDDGWVSGVVVFE